MADRVGQRLGNDQLLRLIGKKSFAEVYLGKHLRLNTQAAIIEDDTPFLVIDDAPNGTLRQKHSRGTQLAPEVILPYIKQAAEALHYARERKRIHLHVRRRPEKETHALIPQCARKRTGI
jgi:serine/threonine protein kinase